MNLDTARPAPILILSDGPDLRTGLGRISHDIAWLLSSMPEFKVGHIGRGAFGRSKYPWQQYCFHASEQWGEERLQEAWEDLSGGVPGIILTVWDASRLLWFADPTGMGPKHERFLRDERKFQKWGYFMLDGAGVLPTMLPMEQAHVLAAYDRVLAASRFGYDLAHASIPAGDLDWLPHGINRTIFKPHDRMYMRSAWDIADNETLIGIVATNQERKHWPVMIEACSRMKCKPRIWVHTDQMMGYWNIPALAIEYGIGDRIVTDARPLTDTEIAARYSSCDATLLISGGEGFSYCTAESISCGTPHVSGSYGAQAELTRPDWHVSPAYFRIETNHNVRRAHYDAGEVALRVDAVVQRRHEGAYENVESAAEHLCWSNIGIQWKKYFKKGLV